MGPLVKLYGVFNTNQLVMLRINISATWQLGFFAIVWGDGKIK